MRLIILFIAVALAAGAFVLTIHFTGGGDKEAPAPSVVATPTVTVKEMPTQDIYTAKEDIPIGALIKPTMLDIQPYPVHLKLPDMVDADPNRQTSIIGMVVRTPFQKGEPILSNKLGNDKDPSFLAASIPKGMRVVTISVDAITGAGGFVFPGDHVDVLVTHSVVLEEDSRSASDNPAIHGGARSAGEPITEVLLSNIRVLAVNTKSVAHNGEPPAVPSNVSIEVSASDAQKIRLTESGNGRMSVALRSIKDKDEMELPRPTGIGDLSRLTPPSYFPVLYGSNGQATVTTPQGQVSTISANPPGQGAASASPPAVAASPVLPAGVNTKSIITVVRGIASEPVEVSRQ